MNKVMMKWVLTQQEEAILYDLAIATACKVKGFREITRNNIKQIRPQVINELLKKTKAVRLKKGLREHINKMLTENVVKDLRLKNQDELLGLIATKKLRMADVLVALVTGETEQATLAESLFASIRDQGNLAHYEPRRDSVPNQGGGTETVAPAESNGEELIECLSQEKEKIVQLDVTLNELREKRKAEVQEWKKERKTYTEEIKRLKTEVENKGEQIMEKEAAIVELKDKVAKLQEEVKRLTQQIVTKRVADNNLLTLEDPAPNKIKVVLLGEGVNKNILQTSKYDVELVGNSQIEDFLQRGSQAEEVWMLSFQISPQKQRKLRNTFTNNNFKEFATLVELQAHINKR